MDNFVTILILSTSILHSSIAEQPIKRSIFSWSKEAEAKDQDVPSGYHPALKVHKYHGVQINPVNGPPIYLPSADIPSANEPVSADQFKTFQLSPEYSQQLDLLNKVVSFLPDADRLKEYDLTTLLPYVDLISDDSLARIQVEIDSAKVNPPSKLARLINFLKKLKELKLKPFKVAASLGANLFHKKKEAFNSILRLGHPSASTTDPPETSTYSSIYPIHYPSNIPSYLFPKLPVDFPSYNTLQGAPPSENVQVQQVDQAQPVAAPANVKLDNRFGPFLPNQVQHHSVTPVSTYLENSYQFWPLQRNEIVEPSPAVTYLSYPQSNQQPFVQQQYYPQYQFSNIVDSSSAPYKNQQKVKINLYAEEPYPSQSSNVPVYRQADQPVRPIEQSQIPSDQMLISKTYPATQTDTRHSSDLIGFASENVEKVKDLSDVVVQLPAADVKEHVSVSNIDNSTDESSSKPKITKLRPVTAKPVYIFPETSVQSKLTVSGQPIASSSPSYETSKLD